MRWRYLRLFAPSWLGMHALLSELPYFLIAPFLQRNLPRLANQIPRSDPPPAHSAGEPRYRPIYCHVTRTLQIHSILPCSLFFIFVLLSPLFMFQVVLQPLGHSAYARNERRFGVATGLLPSAFHPHRGRRPLNRPSHRYHFH
jgi:hypothetical protein